MNFKARYLARSYLMNALGWAFSLTVLIFIYAHIKDEKFHDFGDWLYPNANFKRLKDVRIVTQHYKENVIHRLYYWLPVTLLIDYGIRKLLQKKNKIKA